MKTSELIKQSSDAVKAKPKLPRLIIAHKGLKGEGYRLAATVRVLESGYDVLDKEKNKFILNPGDIVLHIEQQGRPWTKDEALQLRDFITECFDGI